MYLCCPILSKYFVGFSVAIVRLHLSSMATARDPHEDGAKNDHHSSRIPMMSELFPRYSQDIHH